MAHRKRLLFVTDVVPRPLDRGQRVRVAHLLAACRRDFDVTLVARPPDEAADRVEVEGLCERVIWARSMHEPWRQRLPLLARVATVMPGLPRPASIQRFAPLVSAIDAAQPAAFDLIWAERPDIAKLCGPAYRRTIVDLDDLDHRKLGLALRQDSSVALRAHRAYQYVYYRHLETSWARRFLAAVVCSEEDRDYLVQRGCTNALVVPNGANIPAAPRARRPRTNGSPPHVVFLGNLAFEPNADAVRHFVRDIMPLLQVKAPGATLDIIGPNASDEFRRVAGPQVRFRGFVDDLGTALAECDAMVVPLRIGGGTKLKVLDAMAHGLPVVTSPVGAEGLGLDHQRTAWIAEEPGDVVEGILRLTRDAALAAQMSAQAYEHVVERFSWDAIERRLTDWLAGAVTRATAASSREERA